MKHVIAIAALLLSSAATAANPPLRQEQAIRHVVIEVRWAENQRELRTLAKEVGCTDPCLGFSQLAQVGDAWICLITVLRPADWNDKQAVLALGHEQLHCLGYQHDSKASL